MPYFSAACYNRISIMVILIQLLCGVRVSIAGVFPTDAKVMRLATGFSFTEGPAANKSGAVFFTDVPKNRIYQWSRKNGLKLYRKNTGGANGLFVDQADNLIACEGTGRRIVSIGADGNVTALVNEYAARKLNSPNDLWIDQKGGIYFTDPRYGPKDDIEQDGYHVYYLPYGASTAMRVASDLIMPNGLIGTQDGKRLFIADWGAATVFSYMINNDGTLSQPAVFIKQQCDGMTLDNDGNLYLTGFELDKNYFVTVFNREGELIDKIRIPEKPSNLTFGDSDFKTLFITAEKSLYAVRMLPDEINKPIGAAKGVFPGRVVWVHDPGSTEVDGIDLPFRSQQNHLFQAVITDMVSRGIQLLTGCSNDADAWEALFLYFNRQTRHSEGYTSGDKIAIKANFVQTTNSPVAEINHINASPYIILALLRHLVYIVGFEQQDITVYDTTALISDDVFYYCHNEFPHVNFVDKSGVHGRTVFAPDSGEPLYFSCLPGKRYYLPTCVTEADYIINLATLKTHQYPGVTLCAKNHAGSFCVRPFDIHPYIRASHIAHDALSPLVELMGHEHLGGKTVLFMIDALYGGIGWEGYKKKWDMAPFNGDWPSSIFFSQDGVAIDSVGLDFLSAEFAIHKNADGYLHEAALADSPPSGTVYDPELDGISLQSLGVHEHWNNSSDMEYSRNLGLGEGIELIKSLF